MERSAWIAAGLLFIGLALILDVSGNTVNATQGLEMVYEYANGTLHGGTHSLAVNISAVTCDEDDVFTDNFTSGIYEGRGNASANFDAVYGASYWWSYWVDGVYKGCEQKQSYGGLINGSFLNQSDNYFMNNLAANYTNASVRWNQTFAYPADCAAGKAVSGLGVAALTCSSFVTSESDPVAVPLVNALNATTIQNESDQENEILAANHSIYLLNQTNTTIWGNLSAQSVFKGNVTRNATDFIDNAFLMWDKLVGYSLNSAWMGLLDWTNLTGYSLNSAWIGELGFANLTDYPVACPAGQAITQVGDVPTCSAFLTSFTESDPAWATNASNTTRQNAAAEIQNATLNARNVTGVLNDSQVNVNATITQLLPTFGSGFSIYQPRRVELDQYYFGTVSGLIIQNNATNPTGVVNVSANSVWVSNGTISLANDTNYEVNPLTPLYCALKINGVGGLDTGVAVNNWYFLYIVANSTSNYTCVFSRNNVRPTVMPAGYTHSRLLGAVLNGTAGMVQGKQWEDMFCYKTEVRANLTNPLTNVWRRVSLITAIPPYITSYATIDIGTNGTSASALTIDLGTDGVSTQSKVWNGNNSAFMGVNGLSNAAEVTVPIDGANTTWYRSSYAPIPNVQLFVKCYSVKGNI